MPKLAIGDVITFPGDPMTWAVVQTGPNAAYLAPSEAKLKTVPVALAELPEGATVEHNKYAVTETDLILELANALRVSSPKLLQATLARLERRGPLPSLVTYFRNHETDH